MTLTDVLTVARHAGIVLEAEGDRLRVDAPVGAITPELRAALIEHKAAVLAVLAPVEYVDLKGGLVVAAEALRLAWSLEERGIALVTDASHQFVLPDDPRLTDADYEAITRWRRHLAAIVEYRAPEVA